MHSFKSLLMIASVGAPLQSSMSVVRILYVWTQDWGFVGWIWCILKSFYNLPWESIRLPFCLAVEQ